MIRMLNDIEIRHKVNEKKILGYINVLFVNIECLPINMDVIINLFFLLSLEDLHQY